MYTANQNATPVIFNHSAAIDDFVSTALLLTMPNIDLQGIIVTNADCLEDPAMQTSWMVHQFFGLENVPLTLSNARGWNSFPYEYRKDCIAMGEIDILKPYANNKLTSPYASGEAMLEEVLGNALKNQKQVTVLATGPITAITNIVQAKPELAKAIGKIVWMGGAIEVAGNLDPNTIPPEIANPHAEWNAFWDPMGTAALFDVFAGVDVFPLDITNDAKVPPFMAQLKNQLQYRYSEFVYEAYQLVTNEPFYCMWNTCATAVLSGEDGIFAPPEVAPVVVEEYGFNQGWVKIDTYTQAKLQNLYLKFASTQNFYDYVLGQLRR